MEHDRNLENPKIEKSDSAKISRRKFAQISTLTALGAGTLSKIASALPPGGIYDSNGQMPVMCERTITLLWDISMEDLFYTDAVEIVDRIILHAQHAQNYTSDSAYGELVEILLDIRGDFKGYTGALLSYTDPVTWPKNLYSTLEYIDIQFTVPFLSIHRANDPITARVNAKELLDNGESELIRSEVGNFYISDMFTMPLSKIDARSYHVLRLARRRGLINRTDISINTSHSASESIILGGTGKCFDLLEGQCKNKTNSECVLNSNGQPTAASDICPEE